VFIRVYPSKHLVGLGLWRNATELPTLIILSRGLTTLPSMKCGEERRVRAQARLLRYVALCGGLEQGETGRQLFTKVKGTKKPSDVSHQREPEESTESFMNKIHQSIAVLILTLVGLMGCDQEPPAVRDANPARVAEVQKTLRDLWLEIGRASGRERV
jgi:hypothetical protein